MPIDRFGQALLAGHDLPEAKGEVHWSILTKAAQKTALAIAHFSARADTSSNPGKVSPVSSQGMTKIALMTEPTPMLANTSPSEDASSRSSLRSKTGANAGIATTKKLKITFRARMFATFWACLT